MKGLAIDGLCREFLIVDPADGWMFRIFASDLAGGYPTRWEVQVRASEDESWLGIDIEKSTFDDFEEAYRTLDDYMQGRFRAQGYFD